MSKDGEVEHFLRGMGGCCGKVEEVRVFEIFRETLEEGSGFVGGHWHGYGAEIFTHLYTVSLISENGGWGGYVFSEKGEEGGWWDGALSR